MSPKPLDDKRLHLRLLHFVQLVLLLLFLVLIKVVQLVVHDVELDFIPLGLAELLRIVTYIILAIFLDSAHEFGILQLLVYFFLCF